MNSEFCSTCHKVSLPVELNHYKEFLRGQNHYDTFLLSGVSGHGARSFYYPPEGQDELQSVSHAAASRATTFGSQGLRRQRRAQGPRSLLSRRRTPACRSCSACCPSTPSTPTGSARPRSETPTSCAAPTRTGKDASLRIDLFALKEGGTIDGRFLGPLRPELPKLKPGRNYLVEVVIRTVGMGHLFTQGTVDSNEVWVDFTAKSAGKVIGRSGALASPDDNGPVDEWAHRLNVLMLDRNGKRINRRNPQDIFTPLYNHQIPPGAGKVVHYELKVPADVKDPVELTVKVRYRKFDFEYMTLVYGERRQGAEAADCRSVRGPCHAAGRGRRRDSGGANLADQAGLAALERLRHRLSASRAVPKRRRANCAKPRRRSRRC